MDLGVRYGVKMESTGLPVSLPRMLREQRLRDTQKVEPSKCSSESLIPTNKKYGPHLLCFLRQTRTLSTMRLNAGVGRDLACCVMRGAPSHSDNISFLRKPLRNMRWHSSLLQRVRICSPLLFRRTEELGILFALTN